MLEIKDISKSFGAEYIFQNISLTININDKTGIVGNNGVGKTTFLKCLIDDDFLDSGEVNLQNSTIGYLAQNSSLNDNNTVKEELYSLFEDLNKIKEELKAFQKIEEERTLNSSEIQRYVNLENKYLELGGYEIENKFLKFMTGFSFNSKDLDRRISTFSGGEKTKIVLIKLLLLDPDFLILDEPTNHLDIYAIEWLEKYLKSFKKGIILVSHDQEFLNNVCTSIFELKKNNPRKYNTNFSNYLKQKELDYQKELNDYENQQKLIAKYNDFIEKFRGKPSKIGQVNDRKNKLDKINLIEKPSKNNQKIDIKFEASHLKKNAYIDFYKTSFGFTDKKLIQNLTLQIYGGERVFLIGSNGVGKTTLFQTILKEIPLLAGKLKIHSNIKIGYFDQEQKKLDYQKNLFDIIYETKKFESQTAIRKYLARFLFFKEDIYKNVGNLSGGERVRLTLALMALDSYDLLLLDEPTNHLDFESKACLEEALDQFPGSLLIISHDRHLINKLATTIIEIDKKMPYIYQGTWKNYQKYLQENNKESLLNTEENNNLKKKDNIQNILKKEENKKLNRNQQSSKVVKPLKNSKINYQKMKIIEQEIEKYEKINSKLNIEVQKPEVFKDFKKLQKITKQIQETEEQLLVLYQKYEESIGE